ncbi:MAG TPA: ATP-binding protein [Trebonia sp.]|jgi:anti-sigma regulatory factor (Ser/Thr protein kinase)|nr:ATP-binding protein [Trebonia sp.]
MPTVEVAFTPLPAHVRTARLVATAVARRSGVDESVLDEVRLAVGEACSRAVEAHRKYCPAVPIRVTLTDEGERFEVVVIDAAPADPPAAADAAMTGALAANGAVQQLPPGVGLAVIAGLADDVRIATADPGTSIAMSWKRVRPGA